MRITVVGGGNIGTLFAVHCSEKGHEVTLFTSTPELYDGNLCVVNIDGDVIHSGKIKCATNNPETAFREAELIIITFPATMMKKITKEIYEYADKKAIIGVVPGNGGSECAFRRCIERGNIFFGMERVPAIARLVIKGKIVKSTGYKNELFVASLPGKNAEMCANMIESFFDIKTTIIRDYLNLTMTPSNPILHTTRLKVIFKDWREGIGYKTVPLFYEQWDDESSELLIACDEEVQQICRALPEFDLHFCKSLRVHYESPTVDAMTKKISSIEAFKGIGTPTVEKDGLLIPDLHSRYFTSDFSYGLSIIKQIGVFAGVETPNIDGVLKWYKTIEIVKDEFDFNEYNIKDKQELISYYSG